MQLKRGNSNFSKGGGCKEKIFEASGSEVIELCEDRYSGVRTREKSMCRKRNSEGKYVEITNGVDNNLIPVDLVRRGRRGKRMGSYYRI